MQDGGQRKIQHAHQKKFVVLRYQLFSGGAIPFRYAVDSLTVEQPGTFLAGLGSIPNDGDFGDSPITD